MVHAMWHLKNNCAEEGLNSVIDSSKAKELKDAKHKEEVMETVEQFHIEKEAESITKKRKGNRTSYAQKTTISTVV